MYIAEIKGSPNEKITGPRNAGQVDWVVGDFLSQSNNFIAPTTHGKTAVIKADTAKRPIHDTHLGTIPSPAVISHAWTPGITSSLEAKSGARFLINN